MTKFEFILPLSQKSIRKLLFYSLAFLLMSSCATRDEIVYFQGIEELEGVEAPENIPVEIEEYDILRIDVSSLNPEVVEPFVFNSPSTGRSGGGESGSATYGYLVNEEGFITFPVLGEIPAAGKTRDQLERLLNDRLEEFIKDVVVRVRIANFQVTVIGEIGSSVIEVPGERLSIVQALAMAGDISYDGKRDNILVVRMHDGIMTHERLDLTSAEIFDSPYFYLKQNDIVYVEPTYRRVKSAGFITSWQGIVSIITTAFSLFVLFNNI